MTSEPDSALDRAFACARHGWPVLPCYPGSKVPATPHGVHDASIDPDQIADWWRRQPRANVAVATGRPGPDVLDIDNHGQAGNGFTALNQLKDVRLLDGVGTIVNTPNGGLHAYFEGSSQSCGRLPRHHLDFRSKGGYVLVPPSQVDGRSYELFRSRQPNAGLDWSGVTSVLEPHRDHPARSPSGSIVRNGSQLVAWVERLTVGNRNSGLHWAACRAVEAGQHHLLDELSDAAAKAGLTAGEATRTINSARRTVQRSAGMTMQPEAEREAL